MDQPGLLSGAKCVCAAQSMLHPLAFCLHLRLCAMVLLEYGEDACVEPCMPLS